MDHLKNMKTESYSSSGDKEEICLESLSLDNKSRGIEGSVQKQKHKKKQSVEKLHENPDANSLRVVKDNSEHWVASRDLKRGSLVFLDCEAPLVQRFNKDDKNVNRSNVPWQVLSRKFPYNYSCCANCRVDSFHKVFDTNKLTRNDIVKRRGVVVVRTIVDVKKGETLTVGEHFGTRIFNQFHDLGTHMRREVMKEMKFICTCDRCSDPTENGSFTSAVTCPSCFDECKKIDPQMSPLDYGYFLPLQPLDFNQSSPWKCTRCGDTETAGKITERAMGIFDKFMNLFPAVARCRHREVQDGILDGLFEDCRGRQGVHPHSWILVKATSLISFSQNAELDAIQMIPTNEDNLPIDMTTKEQKNLEKAIQRAEFCLSVINKTNPGWTKSRGSTLWILWFGKFLLANRIKTEKMTLDQLVSALDGTNVALDLLKEAVEIRKFEFNPLKTETSAQFNAEATMELERTLKRIETLEKLIEEKQKQDCSAEPSMADQVNDEVKGDDIDNVVVVVEH